MPQVEGRSSLSVDSVKPDSGPDPFAHPDPAPQPPTAAPAPPQQATASVEQAQPPDEQTQAAPAQPPATTPPAPTEDEPGSSLQDPATAESKPSRKRLPKLTPKKSLFAQGILKGLNLGEAARRAGYAPASAKQTGWKLTHRDEAVMAHIEAGREKLIEKHQFEIDDMIAQLQRDRDFAIETKNATAAVRASEILAKVHGYLIERRDVRALGNFRIEIAGIDD